MSTSWHSLEKKEVLQRFGVDEVWGLEGEEVAKRTVTYGENILTKSSDHSLFVTLFAQLKSPLVIILLLALFGTLYLGEHIDAIVIALALVVNIVIGFLQEFRAQRAFDALLSSQERDAVVLRGGKSSIVPAHTLVPGDILILEAGGIVPADSYALSVNDLSVSEAHLTGESAPLYKRPGALTKDAAVYERVNILHSGSPVLAGSGTALVVATGTSAEIGTIAESLGTYKTSETPIEKSVGRLARFLAVIVGIIIVVLLVVGTLRGVPLTETLILAIALAVSVVPEGLPAAVTAILAVGMEQILKKKGLVRNLLAAETLGSTTIILTDKTGTLTQARMEVVDLVTHSTSGYREGRLESDQDMLLNASWSVSEKLTEGAGQELYGDPLERAIVSATLTANLNKRPSTQLDFLKFSSERRFAAALYNKEGSDKNILYINGAPEIVLAASTSYIDEGASKRMSKKERDAFEVQLKALTKQGRRVIAVAMHTVPAKSIPREDAESILKSLTFIGFIAFADPARTDVPAAIREVQGAGVRVVMVTGDTPETAKSVAVRVGIAEEEENTLTGKDIERLDDDALYAALMETPVFGRVLPQQKQRLVRVLQNNGEIVAMTGDGVNDAPALQSAQIGVAVGSGTEVAREASDLILLDDSFSIIVAAIREGRRILDNIKKAITHLITTSFHEVFLISAAVIAGLPLPVLPVQILWVNIFEEGLLTFGYAFEPHEKDAMKRNPRKEESRRALTKEVRHLIFIAGTISGLFSIVLFLWLLSRGLPIEEIRTIMFVVLSLDAIFFGLSLKNLHKPVWTANIFDNKYLLFALGFAAFGIIFTLEFPPLRDLLSLTAPTLFDLVVLTVVAVINIITIEIAKKIAFSEDGKIPA